MAKKSAPAKTKAPVKSASKAAAKAVEKEEVKIKAEKPEKKAKAPKAEKPPKVEKSPEEVQEAKAAKLAKKTADKKAKAEAAAAKAATEEAAKWLEYKNKFGNNKANTYSMSGVFEAQTPLQHKVLGWGYILSVQNDRLEVIFEQGTKILISNYKSN